MTDVGGEVTVPYLNYQEFPHYRVLVEAGLYAHEAAAIEYFGEPPARVLDLGCGAGRTTSVLAAAGFDVVGVDVSEGMIAAAADVLDDVPLLVGDACALQFADDAFDHVLFSYNGLDYVPTEQDRLTALREIRRVLRPGGVFAFSSHNARRVVGSNLWHPMSYVRTLQFWLRNLRAGTLGDRYKLGGDGRRYQITPGNQRAQLRSVGFEVVATLTQHPHDALTGIDPWPYYVARNPVPDG